MLEHGTHRGIILIRDMIRMTTTPPFAVRRVALLFPLLLLLTSALLQPPTTTSAHHHHRHRHQRRPVPTSVNRGRRLQSTVNGMVKRGRWFQARLLLEQHIYDFSHVPLGDGETVKDEHCCVARSFLLLALQCQREGDVDGARAAFREGAERFELAAFSVHGERGEEAQDSSSIRSSSSGCREALEGGCPDCRRAAGQLYQSWGLLESKQGRNALAYSLVRRAVKLDPSLAPVLRWHVWRPLASPPGLEANPRLSWPGDAIEERVLEKTMKDTPLYREAFDVPLRPHRQPASAGGWGSFVGA